MVDVNKAPIDKLINNLKEELKNKKEINPPKWANFAKTGAHKERPPTEEDWWYTRVAAILISVAKLGPIGVGKLRVKYGGKKRRGHKPPRFYKGSGNVIRKGLQQLETAGLIKNKDTGVHKGRILTKEGSSILSKFAIELYKESKQKKIKQVEKKEKPKVEEVKEKPKEVVEEKKVKEESKEKAPTKK